MGQTDDYLTLPEGDGKMGREEYFELQQLMLGICAILKGRDLNGFLDAIDHAETIGPFLDPTLFIQGAATMQRVKRVAVFARSMVQAYDDLNESMVKLPVGKR